MPASERLTLLIESRTQGSEDILRLEQAINKVVAAGEKTGKSLDGFGAQSAHIKGFADLIKTGMTDPLAAVEGVAGKAASSFGPIGIAISAVVGTAVAGGAALASLTHSMGDLANQTLNTAARTGLTTKEVFQFSGAARLAGVDAVVFTTGMRGLSVALGDTSEKGRKAREAMADLKVTLYDVNGQLLPTSQLYLNLAKAIDGVGDPLKRSAVSIDLFKRSGIEMEGLFHNLGRDTAAVKRLDLGFEEGKLREIKAVSDELNKIELIWQNLVNSAKSEIVMKIKPFIDWGSEASEKLSKGGATLRDVGWAVLGGVPRMMLPGAGLYSGVKQTAAIGNLISAYSQYSPTGGVPLGTEETNRLLFPPTATRSAFDPTSSGTNFSSQGRSIVAGAFTGASQPASIPVPVIRPEPAASPAQIKQASLLLASIGGQAQIEAADRKLTDLKEKAEASRGVLEALQRTPGITASALDAGKASVRELTKEFQNQEDHVKALKRGAEEYQQVLEAIADAGRTRSAYRNLDAGQVSQRFSGRTVRGMFDEADLAPTEKKLLDLIIKSPQSASSLEAAMGPVADRENALKLMKSTREADKAAGGTIAFDRFPGPQRLQGQLGFEKEATAATQFAQFQEKVSAMAFSVPGQERQDIRAQLQLRIEAAKQHEVIEKRRIDEAMQFEPLLTQQNFQRVEYAKAEAETSKVTREAELNAAVRITELGKQRRDANREADKSVGVSGFARAAETRTQFSSYASSVSAILNSSPGQEQQAIRSELAIRKDLTQEIARIERNRIDFEISFLPEWQQEGARRIENAKLLGTVERENFQAQLDASVRVYELEKQRDDRLKATGESFTRALLGGRNGITGFFKNEAQGIAATVGGNAFKEFGRTAAASLSVTSDPNSIAGKLLSGTPFGVNPLKGSQDLLKVSTDNLTSAVIANTAAQTARVASISPAGLGSGTEVGDMLGTGGVFSTGTAAGPRSVFSTPIMDGGFDAFGSDTNGLTGQGGNSRTISSGFGKNTRTGFSGFFNGIPSGLSGNPLGVIFTPSGESVQTGPGKASTFTDAQRIGAAAGLAAAAIPAALTIVSGIRQGGVGGFAKAGSAALGFAAAVDPEPISKGILALATVGTALVGSIFGQNPQKRAAKIEKELDQAQFLAPVSQTATTDISGHYVDYNSAGQLRTSRLSPYSTQTQPYVQRYEGGFFNVPGQTTAPTGGAINVYVMPGAVNANMIDPRGVNGIGGMLADSIHSAVLGGQGGKLINTLRTHVTPGA